MSNGKLQPFHILVLSTADYFTLKRYILAGQENDAALQVVNKVKTVVASSPEEARRHE